MVETICISLFFSLLGVLLVYSFRSMDKERREYSKFRCDIVLALNNIAKALRGE